MSKLTTLSLLVAVVLGSAACTHVPAYDRGILAHPTMTSGPMTGPGEAHVYAIHEGAVGGSVGAESGCGCN